jgi:hypothetical protein
MPVKWNMNMKTLKVIAIVLLVVIVLGAGIYWMVSGMSNKGLEGFQTPPTTTTTTTTIPAPPTPSTILENFRKANNTEWNVGKKHTFSVTGTAANATTNRIWGGGDEFGTYTLDSPIAVAAVHAGIVPINKSGIVTIEITKGLESYIASTRNGILSNKFGKYEGSYRFEQDSRFISQLEIGKTYAFKIRGTTGWGIWGGGDTLTTYTADSPIVTAAVHAGIVKDGEEKEIRLIILAGQSNYTGVTRNSITSKQYGPYTKSYRFIDETLPTLDSDIATINLELTQKSSNLVKTQADLSQKTSNLAAAQSELTQKNSNLAAAQSELSAASAALNNAIKSASVEGFQTVGTTTTTTTAQVVSPIMAKINQLKELQKQKADEFAKAKLDLEAAKTEQAAQITSLADRVAGLELELNNAKAAKKTAEDALTTAAQNLADAKDAGIKDKVSIASLESELSNAKTEVTTKQNQIDTINKALAEATANTDTLVKNARIDERLAAEQKYNMLTDSYNILNNELQNAKTEIIRLDSIKNTSALTDPERAKLNKDLLDKQAEISSITTKLMDVESKLRDCSTKLNAAPVAQMLPPPVGATAVPVPPPVGATAVQAPTLGTPNVPMPPPTLVGYPAVQTPTLPNVLLPNSATSPTVQGPIQPAELLPIPPQQQTQPATSGIADNSLTAKVGFTDIPKHVHQQQFQNARSNPYWTYRPENYDSHDRYAAPVPWWVSGYNS